MTRKRVVVLSICAVAVLLHLGLRLVNADSFRPAVQAQLERALGRRVEIGKLRFALLAGGIAADDIAIADDPEFSRTPFLRAKSLEVGVELVPLIFSRALIVNSLTLREPEVTLLHAPSGRWNFSSLGGGTHAAKSQPSGNFSVRKLRIANGRLVLGQTGGQPGSRGKRVTYEDVELNAENVGFDSTIPFTFAAKTPGNGALKLSGTAGPLNRADAAASPLHAQVTIERMDLATTGFLDPASGLGGRLAGNGTLESDGKQARQAGKLTLEQARLVRGGAPAKERITLDYATEYDLRKQAGVVTRGDIRIGSSAARLTGNYDARGESAVVHMKLAGQQLAMRDVQGLLPALGVMLPAGAALEGGTADANLALDGPVDRLVTSGTLNIANARLAGFSLASKMKAISALAGLNPTSETVIQAMSSNLRIAPEGIRAENLSVLVPAIGSLTGSGSIAANNALNFRMVAKLANGGGVLGGMSQITTFGQSKGLPFLVQGTTQNPVFLPDVAGAVGQTVTAPATGLGEVFGGLFGKKKKQ